MLIMILFHDSGYRCFKHFYLEKVCKHLCHLFPKVVSYNHIVELEREVVIPLTLFIKKVLLGKCTGISFVDSTPLRVCKNQRIHIHKVFKGIVQRGKCSKGWFFGFKLHLICNEKRELLNFMITPEDIDDRKPLEYKAFSSSTYQEQLLSIACFQRSRASMYKGPLTHNSHCSEFVELTFLYTPNQEVDLLLFFIAYESGGKTSFIQKVFSLRLFCKRRQMGAQLLSYCREFSFILAYVFIAKRFFR